VTQAGVQIKPGKNLSVPDAPVDDTDVVNKTYADGVLTNAKSYADGVLTNAKSYADGVLTNAKSYADTAASTAQSNAESYTRSYAPNKNGTNASGLWDISVRGYATYIATSNPDGGSLSTRWRSDYYEYRFGGNDSPKGINVCDYDTANITLSRKGNITAIGASFSGDVHLNGHVYSTTYNFTSNYSLAYQSSSIVMYCAGKSVIKGDSSRNLTAFNQAYKPGGGAWANTSDARLKYNIQPLESSLDKIMALKPVSYEWQVDRPNETTVGFIAQDVEKVFPNAVSEVDPQDDEADLIDDKTKTIGWKNDFFAYLVGAIQEQQAIIDKQQAQIEALQADVKSLKGAS